MPYDPAHPTLAVIDIGSNSARMVIYDLTQSPPIKTFNEKVFCALGRDLATTGRLNEEGVIAALKAIQAYALICDVQQIKDIAVVGTASLRDARDGDAFIQQVQQQTGLTIRVISGDEEAHYAARGVLMEHPSTSGIVADFGGGSLEFAALENGQITDTVSLPLGAYRVQAFGDQKEAAITHLLNPVISRFSHRSPFYAIGGSWRSIGASYQADFGVTDPIPTPDIVAFCAHLETMSPDDLQQKYRLERPRAQLAPIAALTLRTVLNALQPSLFRVSKAGVRDGVAHEFIGRSGKSG